jgi:hypothetical protein
VPPPDSEQRPAISDRNPIQNAKLPIIDECLTGTLPALACRAGWSASGLSHSRRQHIGTLAHATAPDPGRAVRSHLRRAARPRRPARPVPSRTAAAGRRLPASFPLPASFRSHTDDDTAEFNPITAAEAPELSEAAERKPAVGPAPAGLTGAVPPGPTAPEGSPDLRESRTGRPRIVPGTVPAAAPGGAAGPVPSNQGGAQA